MNTIENASLKKLVVTGSIAGILGVAAYFVIAFASLPDNITFLLAMLFPVAAAMGLLGGMIGYCLGALSTAKGREMTFFALLLPFLAGAESPRRMIPTPSSRNASSTRSKA